MGERAPAPPNPTTPDSDGGAAQVPFAEAFAVWLKIGFISFGGAAGQIALMHRMLVEERRWLSEARFLHALNFCMLLPGPEAMQLATYSGWLLHGWRGGLVAGLLFVLPGAVVVFALTWIYAVFGGTGIVSALFLGVKAAVLAIVIQALISIARRALKRRLGLAIALAALIAIAAFDVAFPLVVLAAGLLGFFVARNGGAPPGPVEIEVDERAVSWRQTLGTTLLWLAIWLVPLGLLVLLLGPGHILAQLGWFFSKLAVVTFGGAYAVLAYMAQQAVESYGWLTAGEMADGLGLAETTPGPLILVTVFVGFLAGWPGGTGLALAATVVTLWVTFAPCFLWIMAGAPHVERLRGNPGLAGALSAITAAVVGVITNLALWFGLHVIFAELVTARWGPVSLLVPRLGTIDPGAALLFAVACVSLFVARLGIISTLGICAALGLVFRYLL
ncbi:MAG: chromate efflux transporter [Pseudomonadota bacterium]